MQDFQACIRRCLHAIRHESPFRSGVIHNRRLYQNAATSSSFEPRSKGAVWRGQDNHHVTVEPAKPKTRIWEELQDDKKEDKSLAPRGVAAGVQGHIKRELVWLKDPLKLADRTRQLLANGEEQKAFELVRFGSRTMECTISWNALIDYLLAKGRVNAAWQTFNDMKKRAQSPDAFTYTILFRGFSLNSKLPNAVSKAVALYHNMSSLGARVEPSIIHTNAVLQVCARGNDLTSLWSIVNVMPEEGPNAANHVTFTTIFNAIRASIDLSPDIRDPKTGRSMASEESIVQSRQLWADVVKRWRNGDLIIDENLVCSMGRLLLIGSRPQDWDDTFSLVEQTMNIRRELPSLRSGETGFENDKWEPPLLGNRERKAVAESEVDAGREYSHISQHTSSVGYAQPSNKTVSLIMEACEKMAVKRAAAHYWALLTRKEDYGITPDSANCHTYLRIMRTARASAEAVKFIREEMAHLAPEHKTYRIAMSTCVRNVLSPNVMAEAGELMDLMSTRLGKLDIKSCCMWMELGLSRPDGKDTLVAVERLGPQMINLRNAFDRAAERGDELEKEAVLKLMRLMVGGINRILQLNVAREEAREEYQLRMNKLSALITRFTGAKKPMTPESISALRKEKKLARKASQEKRGRTRSKIIMNMDSNQRTTAEQEQSGSNEKAPPKEPFKFQFPNPDTSSDGGPFQIRYGPHKFIAKRKDSPPSVLSFGVKGSLKHRGPLKNGVARERGAGRTNAAGRTRRVARF